MAKSTSSYSVKPRVLVIERDVELQKRIALTLEGAFTIDLTSSGSLALLLMKDYRYACIVASYDLPNRHHGSGILQAVRSMPGGRYVPVIATGALQPDGEDSEPTREGFAAWLRVPSDLRKMRAKISEFVASWD